ncbi:hypothetical protein WN944_027173 [Citrus x changshan-huyou]|uniref:DUF4283 domain-containing protein n=1 Tax=Citrus x changshan-huyou TaxID=2935761 RepID=A0AAP0LJH7_9ROSI
MDTKELIQRCKEISLNGETRGKVTFKGNMKLKGEKIVVGCLMGKVLQNREVNLEGLRSAMSQVWRTVREVRIEELGDNIFMFKFAIETNKKRILTGGPWHFNRALMVLIEPTGLGEETIKEFGKDIGKVEEVDTNAKGECIGKYARLRVSVDVTESLVKILSLEPDEVEKEVVEMVNMEKEDADGLNGVEAGFRNCQEKAAKSWCTQLPLRLKQKNEATKTKKKRKWKLQARAIETTPADVERVKSFKRLNRELNWGSPNTKRKRICSELQTISCSPEAKGKRELEMQQTREVEMTVINTEELTVEAGRSPADNHEDCILECSGDGE